MEQHHLDASHDASASVDVMGDSRADAMPRKRGSQVGSMEGNTSGSAVIDILTQSKDVSAGGAQGKAKSKTLASPPEESRSKDVIDLGAGLPNNLTSIHSEVTSPIGNTGKVFESSYLNVAGFESWRGQGTPPGTHMGPSFYDYDERKAFVQRQSSDETTPLNGVDAKDLYTSLESPQAPELLRVRLKKSNRLCTTSCKVWSLIYVSFFSNCVLFVLKVYIFWQSHSLAVLASAVDSFLDLVSQGIVFLVLHGSQDADEELWPVGRARLEPIGIIVCASLMGMASFQVVYRSVSTIVSGYLEPLSREPIYLPTPMVILLLVAIVLKIVLFLACARMKEVSHSLTVLREDHRNDVLSNSVVLATAYTTMRVEKLWWLDAAGAIAISLYICVVWIAVAKEQAEFLVGRAAAPEFLERIRKMGSSHNAHMTVDRVQAYHFGKRFLVEIEVVLPRDMCVEEAHDIALDFQKRVEQLSKVERAFVHVDYMRRAENEHKKSEFHLNTPPRTPPSEPERLLNAEHLKDPYVDDNVVVRGSIYKSRRL